MVLLQVVLALGDSCAEFFDGLCIIFERTQVRPNLGHRWASRAPCLIHRQERPPRRHQGGSRRLAPKSRGEPPSLPSLGAWGIPLPLVMGLVVLSPRRTPTLQIRRSRLLPSQSRRLGPSGSTPSRRGGRRKKKSASGSRSNSCRRSSNSRDGKEKKKKRKDDGNKENCLRSCWSNTGSKSCWNSRGSNNKRVSS